MRFASPEWLTALWLLLPLTLALGLAAWLKRRTLLKCFPSPAIRAFLLAEVSPAKKILAALLLIGAFGFGVLALARPQWGTQLETMTRRGVDVLIAVDTSLSMDTPDVPPSRLVKAKEELITLLETLQDARVGVISFAGAAFLQCPLTIDRAGARLFLEILDTGLINDPGTDIGQAVALARETFQRRQQKYKVLVLITDGENLAGDPVEEARKAAEEGIRIFTLGIGTPSGQPIPLRSESGEVIGYKKDEGDAPVISRLDETTLAEIARVAGGRYFRASAAELEVKAIAREIDGMDKIELQSKMVRRYQEQFQLPLLAALLCLAAEGLLLDRKRTLRSLARQIGNTFSRWFTRSRRAKSGPARLAAVALFAVLAPFSVSAGVLQDSLHEATATGRAFFDQKKFPQALEVFGRGRAVDPDNPVLAFDIGDTLLAMNKPDEALVEFQKALVGADRQLRSRVFYNMGNAYYQKQDWAQALAHYRQSLLLDARQADVKRNLELAARMMKQQQQDQKNQDPKNQDQKNQDQKQGQNKDQKDQKGQQGQDQPKDKNAQQQKSGQPDPKQGEKQDPKQAQQQNAKPQEGKKEEKAAKAQRLDPQQTAQLLQALAAQEKAELQKIREKEKKPARREGKDW